MTLKQGGARESLRNIGTGVSAIPDSVIDHFEESLYEDQNTSLSDRYSGDTGSFDRNTNSPVYEGSYSLKLNGNGVDIRSDNLNTQPTQGDTFSSRILVGSDGGGDDDIGIMLFNVLDSSNWHSVHVGADGDMIIMEYNNGSFNTLESKNVAVPLNEFTKPIVEWASDDTVTYTLEDESGSVVDSISASISPHTDGNGDIATGFGWRGWDRADKCVLDIAQIE